MRRPVEYLEKLSDSGPIPSPLLNEIIKQMVLFARDYSKEMMAGGDFRSFEEAEKTIFGVELIDNETKNA